MKAVVQRVKQTYLKVDDKEISAIDFGLTVFFCAESKDEEKLEEKILFLAEVALSEKYSSEEITKYYNNFINRFFKKYIFHTQDRILLLLWRVHHCLP